jgi:hypothetical protein
MAEILTALGMDMETPGTLRTPERLLRALFDSTSGYEGDSKLLTAFPTECRGGSDCRISQVIEGPISFFALCEHHALPFHGHAHVGYVAHENHRYLQADAARPHVRAALHGAGAHGSGDRGHSRPHSPASRRRRAHRGGASLYADAGRSRGAVPHLDLLLERNLRGRSSDARRVPPRVSPCLGGMESWGGRCLNEPPRKALRGWWTGAL